MILVIRDERVILDSDLANLYGVETRALIQAVKRNPKRFPGDFIFQLTKAELEFLRSQIVISKGRGVVHTQGTMISIDSGAIVNVMGRLPITSPSTCTGATPVACALVARKKQTPFLLVGMPLRSA